jgi:hypothetical protein
MKTSLIIFLSTFLFLNGCRTLDPSAVSVQVSEKASEKCKNLGVVNVDWSWWGVSSESINAMRNQVAEKGGNTLVQTGNDSGIAYSCPE